MLRVGGFHLLETLTESFGVDGLTAAFGAAGSEAKDDDVAATPLPPRNIGVWGRDPLLNSP